MKDIYKNYENVKLWLYQEVKEENLEEVMAGLIEALNLDLASIKAVLSELEEDNEIAIVDEVLYVMDKIHFVRGNLRSIRGKFGFVGEGDVSIYVAAEDFQNAIDGDEVLVRIKHSDKKYGQVIHVLKRNKKYLLGTLKIIKKKFVFEAYDRKIPNQIEFNPNNIKPIPDQRIVAKILNVENGIIEVSLESVLGMSDDPGIDILSVLFEHDLETEFNQSVLNEIGAIPDKVLEKDLAGRLDHRNQYVVTVDGEDAKDLDDALYLERLNEGFRLYVHIADVSYYVAEGSAIDKTALKRSSSIYMVDRVIPMLPKELSNGVCSLHPNVDRLTLTCKMDIDFKGEIYNYEVYPSVINSKRRMSYNEINDGDDFAEVDEMINSMLELSDILSQKRIKEGSIDFDSDESQFLVNHKGEVLDIFARTSGRAEKMIENFMVSANESIAKYARYQDLPILYRVHEKPDQDKMRDLSHTLLILGYRLRGNLADVHPYQLQQVLKHFENRDESLVVSRLMLRSMQKARYEAKPEGHFGLALDDYAHFTAPIRRYADLLTHRNLRKYIFEHNFSEFEDDHQNAQEVAKHVSEKERDILEAEREVEKMKKAEFMASKINEKFEGIISGVNNFGIFVELPNTVEGVILLRELRDDFYTLDAKTHKLIGERTNRIYALGDKVEVIVDSIDPLENDVILRFDQNRKRGRRNGKKRFKK